MARMAAKHTPEAQAKALKAQPAPDTGKQKGGVTYIDVQTAGALLELHPERVRQLVKMGYIERHGQGQYVLVNVVRGYIRYLREEREKATATHGKNKAQEARTREIELRIARDQNKLIETEEAIEVLDEIIGSLKSEMIGLPARLTHDVEQRRVIEAEINAAFARTEASFQQKASALRESGEAVQTDRTDDT